MIFLISHIFLCLLIAALIGGVIGWWLRGLRWQEHTSELQANHDNDLRMLQSSLENESTALAEAQASRAGGQEEITTLRADLAKAEGKAGEKQKETDKLNSQLAEAQASLKAALSDSEEKVGLLGQSKSRLEGVQGELKTALASAAAGKDRAKSHEKDLADLRRRLTETETKAKQVETQAAENTQNQKDLQQKLQQAEQALQAAEQAKAKAEQETEAGRQELAGLRLNLDEVNSALTASQSQVAKLEPQLEECRQARAKLETMGPAAGHAASAVALGLKGATGGKPARDDLKKVEGIGPKIEQLLNQDGIYTWAALSVAKIERLQGILDAAGPRYRIHDPGTWPRQAALAANGQWQELNELQDHLKGGRES